MRSMSMPDIRGGSKPTHSPTDWPAPPTTILSLDLPPIPAPTVITMLSLPLELIEVILFFCTNAALLAISQTCTGLHVIALHIFFTRNNISNPLKGSLSARTPPRETLEAVRVALFVKQLSSVIWDFDAGWECSICQPRKEDGRCPLCRSDPLSGKDTADSDSRIGPLKRTFDEIASLRAIFARLPEVGLVSLDFHLVDRWVTGGPLRNNWRNKLDKDLWKKEFVGLLDEVLANGCQALEIKNGMAMKELYSVRGSRKRPVVKLPPGLKKWKGLKLKDMSIHSDMLLMSPFLESWTFSFLTSSACAATLTRLSFQPQTTSIHSLLLTSLRLPNLAEFEIRTETPRIRTETPIAKFEDVAVFLERHSGWLRKVNLYGVGLPLRSQDIGLRSTTTTTFGRGFNSKKQAILPQLDSITAHPAYITWLLNTSRPTPTNLSSNTSLGSLKSIGITSEDYGSHMWGTSFDYALFDEAMNAVVSFCKWENDDIGGRNFKMKEEKQAEERTIELTLKFNSQEGVDQWFASHLSPSPWSAFTRLTHISILTISTAPPVKLSAETINNLPAWLAIVSNAGALNFPISSDSTSTRYTPGDRTISRLQRVKFIDHPANTFPDGDTFARRVAEECVGLKWIQMDSNDEVAVDLDKFREPRVGADPECIAGHADI